MKICTFFGHRDAPMALYPEMLSLVTRLVTEHGVTDFYCGARGNFDAMGASAVLAVKGQFPNVRLYEVLAYLPTTSAAPSSAVTTVRSTRKGWKWSRNGLPSPTATAGWPTGPTIFSPM
jgi:hypothetical protein